MTAALIDVNLLVALLYSGHSHSKAALAWLDRQDRAASIAVCRTVEMGALRVLTRRAVMGDDVLSPAEFWQGWDVALRDERIVRIAEAPDTLATWRALSSAIPRGATADTDAYLAAFAIAGYFTLATFDRGFARFAGLRAEVLAAAA